jgi:hypothetical protein
MISFPTSARIVVAAKPVDFRRGGESLAALAKEVLKEDPFAGVIVIFRSRRADRVGIRAGLEVTVRRKLPVAADRGRLHASLRGAGGRTF